MSRAQQPTISRRAVIAGAVSIPLSGIAGPGAATSPSEIDELGRRFKRLVRRGKRLHRRVVELGDQCACIGSERDLPPSLPDGRRNPRYDDLLRVSGYDFAWRQWSEQVEETLAVAAAIRRAPASNMADLDVRFRALMWELQITEAADPEPLRLLREFGRELRKVCGR